MPTPSDDQLAFMRTLGIHPRYRDADADIGWSSDEGAEQPGDYLGKLAAAERALNQARGEMEALDIGKVEEGMISAAERKAAQGDWLAAQTLLALVPEFIEAAKYRKTLKARLPRMAECLAAAVRSRPRTGAPEHTAETAKLTGVLAELTTALDTVPADLGRLAIRLNEFQTRCETLKYGGVFSDSLDDSEAASSALAAAEAELASLKKDLAKIAPAERKVRKTLSKEKLDRIEGLEARIEGQEPRVRELTQQRDALTLRVREQLAQDDGMALLDRMMRDSEPGPAQVLLALEVRFNLLAEGARDVGVGATRASAKELQRIYLMMTEVPDAHTRGNPSLKKVTRRPPGGGVEYISNTKEIVVGGDMSKLRTVGERTAYGLGNPEHMPDLEDRCRLDPDVAAPKNFDWNVLHEVAHAVDEHQGIMTRRAGEAMFGAWRDHGVSVDEVASAAAKVFCTKAIDAAMIKNYLSVGTVPAPAIKRSAAWIAVEAWVKRTSAEENPWDKGTQCRQAAVSGGLLLGDRVFHQQAKGRWVSYALAARQQGVSGYQFKSPGEWFSELYAAYKSKVLKPSHPAIDWLDPLFGRS